MSAKTKSSILVVDDTPANLDLLEEILARRDYEVRKIPSGQLALTSAKTMPPDLILLDIRMPDLDGYEVCELLKADECTRSIPVIFISALQDTSDKLKAFAKGGVDYITKPFHSDEVLARVTTHLQLNDLRKRLDHKVKQRTAELEAANKELEGLCYTMSHNLRAPLRHINGYVELLLSHCRAGLCDKDLHYLETVAGSARQMGVLLDDLLQFLRIGRTEMQQKSIDMNQALQEALAAVKDACAQRAIQWVIGKLPRVRGDYSQIRQVWANLLENAVKFTQPKAVARIEISSYDGDHEIIFAVSDNGVGFDMQYADKLFGVFQRLHSQDEFEGTGIGLANVQLIVNRHGGKVWVEAEPNRGATFYFSLPRPDIS